MYIELNNYLFKNINRILFCFMYWEDDIQELNFSEVSSSINEFGSLQNIPPPVDRVESQNHSHRSKIILIIYRILLPFCTTVFKYA